MTNLPEPRAADLFAGGLTRTAVHARHALLTPDGLRVVSRLPGWDAAAEVVVAISPAMGARSFTQLHVGLPLAVNGGAMTPNGDGNNRLVYVTSGRVLVSVGNDAGGQELEAGGFAFLPPGTNWRVQGAGEGGGRMVIFQKPYQSLPSQLALTPIFGREDQCPSAPFLGDPDAMLTTLLPDHLSFDMAVNVFRFAPGASLPFVETHVMEHGLLMLSGRGIYRLENEWYPVRAGDTIWMAPFCPQWFGALGREGASYLYYKDVNRA